MNKTPFFALGSPLIPKHQVGIMGVLNVTPDSFSDGGKFFDVDAAVEFALSMEKDGADVIDIGAESTRPGADPIDAAEQIHRIEPVIKKLKNKLTIPISIDTSIAEVMSMAVKYGAAIINDVSALQRDPELVKVTAKSKLGLILMHMKSTPKDMQLKADYSDVTAEVVEFLMQRIEYAVFNGIKLDHIMIDPGIGFGKKIEHNLALLRDIQQLKKTGRNVLIGASRKSFINAIDESTIDGRLGGSIAAVATSLLNGADWVRVHDVRETVQFVKVFSTILESEYANRLA